MSGKVARGLGSVFAGIVCLAAAGCGDDSDAGSAGAGGSSRAGASGRAGSGGGGRGGSGGNAALMDAGSGASVSDAAGAEGGSGGYTVPPGCPAPSPEPVAGQLIAIQSINFNTSEIVLRNVSDDDVTIAGTRQGWQWCNVPAYWNIAEEDVTLAPGQTFAFLPYYNLTGVRELYRGDDSFDTNEMGIYTGTGSFNNSELIAAFVSWGEGAELETRESIASMALLWRYGDRIAIGPGDDGFIVTGRTDRGDGYTSVPSRCLVAPPNP